MCTTDFFFVSHLVVHFLSRVFNVTAVLHMAYLWKQLSYIVCTNTHMYTYICVRFGWKSSPLIRCLVCCPVDLLPSQWEEIDTYRGYLLAASFSSISCLNVPYVHFRIDNFGLKWGGMNRTQLCVHAWPVHKKDCCFLLYIRSSCILHAGIKIVVSVLR